MRRGFVSRRLLLALLALGIAAAGCSSGSPPSASVSLSVSPSPSLAPTPTLKPMVAPRPTDLPTDGECEEGYACLGVLEPGITYRTNFGPSFRFQAPSSGWENLVTTKDGVVAVLVDANDRSTYDSQNQAANQIFRALKFE